MLPNEVKTKGDGVGKSVREKHHEKAEMAKIPYISTYCITSIGTYATEDLVSDAVRIYLELR